MKAGTAKALVDQALEELGQALSKGKRETLVKYLSAMARFYRYSPGNLLLIFSQRPDAIRVAGFHTWRNLGRCVRKGEKGIRIFAPIVSRRPADDAHARGPPDHDDDATGEDEDPVIRFKPVYVFDVSQTHGRPLPEPARVTGSPNGCTERVKRFIAANKIGLEYSTTLGAADGLSHGSRITPRQGLAPAEEFSVRFMSSPMSCFTAATPADICPRRSARPRRRRLPL